MRLTGWDKDHSMDELPSPVADRLQLYVVRFIQPWFTNIKEFLVLGKAYLLPQPAQPLSLCQCT
jgi:hypothetical protein